MRSWQRSASACTGVPVVSRTRRRRTMTGDAAIRSGWASRQSNSRSVTSTARAFVELVEERVDVLPHLGAALEADPVRADQADQLVAGVDGDEEALEPPGAVPPDEHRLDIGLGVCQ